VQAMREALELAREDEHIKALILRIDSPGGGVTASDIMYHELLQYREETDVPVIAMLMGTAASGGYYIASAADRIVAHPTTVTGSIGVIVVGMNIQGLEDLVGVQVEAHTSGEHKDILSPFREMTDEERGIVQSVIDDMFGQFVDVVSAGRADHGLTRDQILTLADGRIYTAQQALDSGLVDEITYLPELIDDLKDEHDLRDVEVITYRRGYGASQTIYSRAPSMPSVDLNLISPKSVLGDLTPGFHYLWVPGL
jgi:protease-4